MRRVTLVPMCNITVPARYRYCPQTLKLLKAYAVHLGGYTITDGTGEYLAEDGSTVVEAVFAVDALAPQDVESGVKWRVLQSTLDYVRWLHSVGEEAVLFNNTLLYKD